MKKLLCLNKKKKLHSAIKEFITIRGNTVILNKEIDLSIETEQIVKLLKLKNSTLCIGLNKKQLILGRTYNNELIDFYKFKINKIKSSLEFDALPPEFASKYFLIIQNCIDKRLENLIIDLLHQPSHEVDFEGTRYAWIFSQIDGLYTLKYVRVTISGSIEDIGPLFELKVENNFNCGDEIWNEATKVNKKKIKNIEKNACKDIIGKIHIDKQDLRDIKLKRSRGYKTKPK